MSDPRAPIGATQIAHLYPQDMLKDLAKSGLVPADLQAKPLTAVEKQATLTPMGTDGYVIPYFDMKGKTLPFYRVKLLHGDTGHAPQYGPTPTKEVKYRQIADAQNHIYFPPRLAELLPTAQYIILTEGEKKAVAAVKRGFPCVAVGGVDSWRSRTLTVPKDTTIAQKPNGALSLKLPQGGGIGESMDTVAVGFNDLIYYLIRRKIPIIICYDTDNDGGLRYEVQRAAATLGFELRHRGIPIKNIRHLILDNSQLPESVDENGTPSKKRMKLGLDDLLTNIPDGVDILRGSIKEVLERRSAFPRHPNIRDHVNRKLQKATMGRSELMHIAMAILSDLDSRGQRLREPDTGSLYYFSNEDKSLVDLDFDGKNGFADTPFGRYLYNEYNVGIPDWKVLGWLASMFAAEDPIMEVHPEKVLTWRGDTLYYQINYGTMAKVTKDEIKIVDNGTDSVLFETKGLISEIPTKDFRVALMHLDGQTRSPTLPNWWYPVLQDARVRRSENDYQRKLLSLLYYVSPFFYRWQGTQLPIEMTIGEAGSGKSTLFELRLSILTGLTKLGNPPRDVKDWTASLAHTGGLHVTDNVQLGNNELRQSLSDEICRLITEPKPSISQRKLYSDTDLVTVPVRCVFGITAIKQPFTNVDIIQRAIITELDKGTSEDLSYDANWKSTQLDNRGGRHMWLAHHLIMVQRILQLAHKKWSPTYKAKYRLINLEQLLLLTADVLGEDNSWVRRYLEETRDKKMSESDWALAGLVAYSKAVEAKFPGKFWRANVTAEGIVDWCADSEEFRGCQVLSNPRSVIRYMQQHKHSVATTAKLVPFDEEDDNNGRYHVLEPTDSQTTNH